MCTKGMDKKFVDQCVYAKILKPKMHKPMTTKTSFNYRCSI